MDEKKIGRKSDRRERECMVSVSHKAMAGGCENG